MRRTLILLCCVAWLVACGRREEDSVRRRLGEVDRLALLSEVRQLHSAFLQRNSTELADANVQFVADVPKSEWSPTIRQFEPGRVFITRNGVSIVTHKFFEYNAGLFVTIEPTYDPTKRSDAFFERIEESFYFFSSAESPP